MAEEKKEIRISTVRPLLEGLRQPAPYANFVRVAYGPDGFMLYFFQVPPDAFDLPEVDVAARNGEAEVELQLVPSAKVFASPGLIPAMIKVLERFYGEWSRNHGPKSAEPSSATEEDRGGERGER